MSEKRKLFLKDRAIAERKKENIGRTIADTDTKRKREREREK